MAKRTKKVRRPSRWANSGTTASVVREWKARWEVANQLDLEDARRATPDERYRALVQLMQFALSFPITRQREEEEQAALARWQKLREAYHARLASS